MGRMGSLIKVATVVGPAVLQVVVKYGPQIKDFLKKNPELLDVLKTKLAAIANAGKGRTGTSALNKRVNVLREQAGQLYAQAADAKSAMQAAAWRSELDNIQAVLPVVDTLSKRERTAQRKKFEKQLDAIAAQIVEKTITEEIEDAEVVEE